MSLFGRDITVELAHLSGVSSPKDGSPQLDTALVETPDAQKGVTTRCMHFSIKTHIGWIPWKEREATLYSLFERAFAAVRCELKFSDMLEEMAMEVEIPNEQVDKFKKFFNGKALAQEIDKLHGIEPALCKWKDVKLSGLKETSGMNDWDTKVRSSVDAITARVQFLEECGLNRQKEIDGIKEIAYTSINDIQKRYDGLQQRIDHKVYEKCGSKFDTIENSIISTVRSELSFIATPLPFKHPPDGHQDYERVSGAHSIKYGQADLNFLNNLKGGYVSGAPPSPISPQKLQSPKEADTSPKIKAYPQTEPVPLFTEKYKGKDNTTSPEQKFRPHIKMKEEIDIGRRRESPTMNSSDADIESEGGELLNPKRTIDYHRGKEVKHSKDIVNSSVSKGSLIEEPVAIKDGESENGKIISLALNLEHANNLSPTSEKNSFRAQEKSDRSLNDGSSQAISNNQTVSDEH